MKTLKKIMELNEAEDKKLTSLIRAGLFDIHKLPLLKRALSKDNTKMSPAERNSLLDLLDTLIAHVTGDSVIYNKVRSNIMHEDLEEAYETAGDLPMVLILKRKSIRAFPDGQRVALYWADKLNTYISVPYSSVGVGYSPSVSEEIELEEKYQLHMVSHDNEKMTSKVYADKKSAQDAHWKQVKANRANKDSRTKIKSIEIKKVNEDDIQELSKEKLKSYVGKAKKSHDTAIDDTNAYLRTGIKKYKNFDKSGRDSLDKAITSNKTKEKRAAGISLAVDKIVKENIDIIAGIVNENSDNLLNFNDGTQYTCGPFTAAAILETYNKINDTNKIKMKKALNESKVSFIKTANFSLKKA